jgi:branched-chain amino acid transport system substrate-binding protein
MKTKERSVRRQLVLILILILTACAPAAPATEPAVPTEAPEATEAPQATEAPTVPVKQAPEKIIIGNAIALSGPNAPAAALSQVPSYDLWVDDVNAAGGIYVKEFDKKIPVEILRYDDTSDVGTAVQLVEKLIVEDKVNFILPPWGTATNFAIAPLVSEHTMPTLGCTVSSKQLAAEAENYPSFFGVLNQAPSQGAALVAVAQELGVKTAAVIHHTDLHGIEFAGDVLPQLSAGGIDVVLYKTFPAGATDLSQLLREVQAANVDALIAFSYPPETFLMTGQMREIGLNPKMFYATVGVAFPVFRDAIAAGGAAEGVMGAGTWNPQVKADDAQGYFDRHVAKFKQEPDRWASAACYASGQILQQAIEAAGTLDPAAVQEEIATGEFNTILGTVKFKNHFNTTYPGNIGQWQNGEFVIIDPGENRQADPIYPKPEWPSQ